MTLKAIHPQHKYQIYKYSPLSPTVYTCSWYSLCPVQRGEIEIKTWTKGQRLIQGCTWTPACSVLSQTVYTHTHLTLFYPSLRGEIWREETIEIKRKWHPRLTLPAPVPNPYNDIEYSDISCVSLPLHCSLSMCSSVYSQALFTLSCAKRRRTEGQQCHPRLWPLAPTVHSIYFLLTLC